ncbi:MAG: WG repeat-containing protein [Leptospiraceae bacterium]|nr:WG repeat-containing protein [Leptospiraceae bacterium]
MYLDKEGKIVLETDFEQGAFFDQGIARVCGKTCGYIDSDGEKRFGFNYQRIGDLSQGLIDYCDSNGCGFLDRNGKVVLKPQYDEVLPFSEGLAGASKNGRWGFIDRSGRWVISPVYGSVDSFSEGRAAVQSSKAPHLYGIIDTSGGTILPFKYQRIYPFSSGLARFFHWDRFGFLDRSGTMELSASLEWAEDPSQGLAFYIHDNRQGFRKGNTVVISLDCAGGHSFSANPVVALVRSCKDGRWTYIDGAGATWKGGYIDATNFENGFAFVRLEDQEAYSLLNDRGEVFALESDIRPGW